MPKTDVVRIEVTKTITYQGPANWVLSTLSRSIQGTLQCAPGKFITGEVVQLRKLEPVEQIEADNRTDPKIAETIQQHESQVEIESIRKGAKQ